MVGAAVLRIPTRRATICRSTTKAPRSTTHRNGALPPDTFPQLELALLGVQLQQPRLRLCLTDFGLQERLQPPTLGRPLANLDQRLRERPPRACEAAGGCTERRSAIDQPGQKRRHEITTGNCIVPGHGRAALLSNVPVDRWLAPRRTAHARSGRCRRDRSRRRGLRIIPITSQPRPAGNSSQVRPSSTRPAFRLPRRITQSGPSLEFAGPYAPHCLNRNGTPAARHWSRKDRAHSGRIGRAPRPDSPPTITQSGRLPRGTSDVSGGQQP